MKKKVAVAMSGGVDSGVAAALLVKAGYQCTGFHLHFWKEPGSEAENKCCSLESLAAARQTARQLGMPFYTLDFSRFFKKKVVDDFIKAYQAGLTPNPCVRCNKFVKFGRLLDYVLGAGFDYLATGHYAKVSSDGGRPKRSGGHDSSEVTDNCKVVSSDGGNEDSRGKRQDSRIYRLLAAKDKRKDQTYFLYNLTQKQLAHILFPLGEYTKTQVRQLAKKWRLPVAERPESQEICFLPENDYRPFLRRHLKIKPGKVADTQGKIIGQHQGLPLYTIGQRHGFEITDKKALGPWYVIGKNIKNNLLIVGFGRETEKKEFRVKQVNWISGQPPKGPLSCQVRIRHQGELLNCKVADNKVLLKMPQRGVAAGQSAVFYQKGEVLGGGVISD